MRVLVIGASGAIGSRLVPQLIEHGHEVVGSARSPAKAEQLRRFGARPIVLDILDAGAAGEAVAAARAERRASLPTGTRAQAGRSRPRMTRSTPTRPRRRARPLPR
jgi:uncharacterized protein YbjT (DUF2867 family)